MSKLIRIILIILSVIVGGYFWQQSDMVESAMLIRQGTNKITVLQGTKKITANGSQNSFLTNGLVGMWSFNGYDVTDKIYDRSGQNNNGYFGTSTATTSAKIMGKVGQALSFDGVDDIIKSFPSSISSIGARSICLWFNTSSTIRRGLIGTRANTGNVGFGFTINRTTAGNLTYYRNAGETIYQVAAGIIPNKWYHTCVTLSSNLSTSVATLYLNGGSFTPSANFGIETASSFKGVIGNEQDNNPAGNFSGKIDEVRIYNRALTAAEVMSLWQAGR